MYVNIGFIRKSTYFQNEKSKDLTRTGILIYTIMVKGMTCHLFNAES